MSLSATEVNNSTGNMEKLPNEVLMMIFGYLSGREMIGSVRHVCQRWAALLEKHVVVLDHCQDFDNLHLGTRAVRIVTRKILFPDFIALSSNFAINIRDLTIYEGRSLSPDDYILLKQLPHLEHLDVFLRSRVLNYSLVPMLMNLKSIVINEIVPGRVLRLLASSKTLQCLYMYGRALYYPRRELLSLIRSKKFHLRELTLRCTELHDASYAAIGQCEGLTSLHLYSCWLMTGAGALHTTRPRKLRRLHITGARIVRTRSLMAFLDRLPPNIEELNLSMTWFGDEHVATLIHCLPKLRVLELWNTRVTAQGVLMLAEHLTELSSLDLNILLTNEQILRLDRHPSLLFLRCLTAFSLKNNPNNTLYEEPDGEVEQVVTKTIKVVPTDVRYSFKYFRGTTEGYRASLYYYWTQDIELRALPHGAPPPCVEDDEYY